MRELVDVARALGGCVGTSVDFRELSIQLRKTCLHCLAFLEELADFVMGWVGVLVSSRILLCSDLQLIAPRVDVPHRRAVKCLGESAETCGEPLRLVLDTYKAAAEIGALHQHPTELGVLLVVSHGAERSQDQAGRSSPGWISN